MDRELVLTLARTHWLFVTLEENVLQGGFGLQVTAIVHEEALQARVLNIALPDAYVEHGNVSLLRESLGIDSDSVIRAMREFCPERMRQAKTAGGKQFSDMIQETKQD